MAWILQKSTVLVKTWYKSIMSVNKKITICVNLFVISIAGKRKYPVGILYGVRIHWQQGSPANKCQ